MTANIFPHASVGCTAVAVNGQRRGRRLELPACIQAINMRKR